MNKIIGRKKEIAILDKAFNSEDSRLIAIYGRRRVGKTFLIREHYKSNIKFEITGINGGSYSDQLKNFTKVIKKTSPKFKDVKVPKDWLEAFDILENYLDSLKGKKKKVIFIDEFPWLATRKSKFLGAFENFWNSYATKRNDLVVVVCGSTASYMINKILKNKGQGQNTWKKLQQSNTFKVWSGFSFETLCLKHIDQIKKALNIEVIISKNDSWFNDKAQIDLLIDREDGHINICELKFYNAPFKIDANYVKK